MELNTYGKCMGDWVTSFTFLRFKVRSFRRILIKPPEILSGWKFWVNQNFCNTVIPPRSNNVKRWAITKLKLLNQRYISFPENKLKWNQLQMMWSSNSGNATESFLLILEDTGSVPQLQKFTTKFIFTSYFSWGEFPFSSSWPNTSSHKPVRTGTTDC